MASALRKFLFALCAVTAAGAQTLPPALLSDLHWRNIGPFRGGRTRAATGVPSQPNLFYMAPVNGGVWKSDDFGRTWLPIFDSQPTQSIGAIAVAPSDASTIYVASGEGLQRPDLSIGNGIYKSTDAGKTWQHLGLRDGQQIPALAVDPHDKNRLFAAVLGHPYGPNPERGIYRSADGGVTWQKSLYLDENTGASDVAIDPTNPDIVYAGLWSGRQGPWEFGNDYAGPNGGLYKSTDGGKTWNKLTNGLPADASQTYVSLSPLSPNRIYAAIVAHGNIDLYRSDDAGATWIAPTNDPRPKGRTGGGSDFCVKVDPQNPDTVYMTSMVIWRSTDAGKTWTALKGAPGGDDYQDLWINPRNPDIILLVSDQGAAVTVNAGLTWSSWYNQSTAQLYHAITTNEFPYKVCAGQQESGSVCVASRGNDGGVGFREWHPAGVIEYGYVAPDPLNPDLIYGSGRGQVSKYRQSTGQVQMVTPSPLHEAKYRTDRTSPLIFSPVDPHVLYQASNFVFKTVDGGNSWQTISPDLTRETNAIPASLGNLAAKDEAAGKKRGVVYSLAPSHQSVSTLWAGTDEGLIWVTRDGGLHWKDVTPKDIPGPWSKITQIDSGHFDDLTAYASVSRFRVDDLQPRIYRTHDGGKTWSLIVNGLPGNAPIDTVREDPVRKGLLFAGSENAVWFSLDDGDHWQPLQLNLPHTSMRDLWIRDADLIVATHGRGFWILDDITPLRQVKPNTLTSAAWLAKPAKAWRVRDNNNPDTPLPPEEPMAENPPDGAVIDFFLRDNADVVKLEILDAAGKVVRRYSSDDEAEPAAERLKEMPMPDFWVQRPGVLPKSAGLHRFVWDLHYATPDSEHHTYPIAAVKGRTPRLPRGAMALPGVYTVRLIAGGQTLSVPLTVAMDPRVKKPALALQQLFRAEVRLTGLITQSTEAIRVARAVTKQLDKEEKKAHAIHAELKDLNEKLLAFYADLDAVDAAPTSHQAAAVTKLAADTEAALARWALFVKEDIPALNKNRATPISLKPDAKQDEDEAFDDIG